jgi:hypothetical protein
LEEEWCWCVVWEERKKRERMVTFPILLYSTDFLTIHHQWLSSPYKVRANDKFGDTRPLSAQRSGVVFVPSLSIVWYQASERSPFLFLFRT